MNRVALDVARLAGIALKPRRIAWSSVFLAMIIGVPLGYWTFKLNQDGFAWYSLFPGTIAGLLAISILGMFLPSQDESAPPERDEFLIRPPAGDINAPRD